MRHILGFDLAGLTKVLVNEFGCKPYLAKQIFSWVHQRGILDYKEMSNISKKNQEILTENFASNLPEILDKYVSKDKTTKLLFKFDKGNAEAVWIPHAERNTICVSTQVGCPVGCTFCASGYQQYKGNLTADEIIAQIWIYKFVLGVNVSNVVFMGMGEPLLNFDNVITTCNILGDDFAYHISHRKITISTSGIVPKIYEMVGKTDVALAISLHAPNDEIRDKIIPINLKYPLVELIKSVNAYMDSLSYMRKSITIEYTLIKDINDSLGDARELARLLKRFNVMVKVNLIPYNEHDFVDYETITDKKLYDFADYLVNAGYLTTIRGTRGDKINAACGQLSASYNDD